MRERENPTLALPSHEERDELAPGRLYAIFRDRLSSRWPEVAADFEWVIRSWLRPADSEARWEQDGPGNRETSQLGDGRAG
jgi:hypothetical protein